MIRRTARTRQLGWRALGLAVPLLAAGCETSPEPAGPDIVLISIDTLRADRLNSYGYERRKVSPAIDALAADGVQFDAAITSSPWTTPAHMSLFTGLLPTAHGWTDSFPALISAVGSNQIPQLAESIPTLPEQLERAGYDTAAFTGGVTLDPRIGFARGFDSYDVSMDKLSDEGMGRMFDWLGAPDRRRVFLFFHTFEAHAPYLDTRFLSDTSLDPEVASGLTEAMDDFRTDFRAGVPPSAVVARIAQDYGAAFAPASDALYDGGIASVDERIGELMAELKRLGRYEDALIVLLSDHGEELGDRSEGGLFGRHGHTVFEEMVRIPLIVKLPGGEPAGARVSEVVSMVDVPATIADLAGLPPWPGTVQGRSLRSSWERSPGGEGPPALVEALAFEAESKAMRSRDLKYVLDVEPGVVAEVGRAWVPEGIRGRLYHLENDPDETTDLCAEECPPELADRIAAFEAAIRANAAQAAGPASGSTELDEETLKRLRALGYVQ